MYFILNGLMVGFIETAKVGINIVASIGGFIGELFNASAEIHKEGFDD